MNLIAERLKKIDDPCRFYNKRSTENKPFFIKNHFFTVQKRVMLAKTPTIMDFQKKMKTVQWIIYLLGKSCYPYAVNFLEKKKFLDLKKFSIQNKFWYKKNFQHKKNLNAKNVWTLKKSELAKNWSIIYIFLDGIEFDNEKNLP